MNISNLKQNLSIYTLDFLGLKQIYNNSIVTQWHIQDFLLVVVGGGGGVGGG